MELPADVEMSVVRVNQFPNVFLIFLQEMLHVNLVLKDRELD